MPPPRVEYGLYIRHSNGVYDLGVFHATTIEAAYVRARQLAEEVSVLDRIYVTVARGSERTRPVCFIEGELYAACNHE